MSTKIFHGCRAPRSMDVLELADRVRAVITPLRLDLERSAIMDSCSNIIDREALQQVQRSTDLKDALAALSIWSPFFAAMDAYDKSQEELGENSALHDPHRFSMQVIPSGDHLYLLPFVQQQSYIDALCSIDGVEHYPYWNSGDGPDDLTAAEWDERGQEWMSVPGMDYGQIPAQHGVTVDLGMQNSPGMNLLFEMRSGESKKLLSQQPDLLKRRTRIMLRALDALRPMKVVDDEIWSHVRSISRKAKALAEMDGLVIGLEPLTIEMVRGVALHPPIWIDWELLRESLEQLESN